MKVLIADDNLMWRNLLARQLNDWGYEAVPAEDGTEAWDLLQEPDAPRLVILDWQMPGMDGIEVCSRVKALEDRPFTYVIMLSSRDEQEDMVAGLDAGADEYLTKPVEPVILRSRLAAAKRIVAAVPPKDWTLPRVPGYQVKRLLGKGAFATVWAATQESTGMDVALKILRVDLATEEVFDRFTREIQLLQKMNHPNIARIFDSHIDSTLGFCAMELIEGLTFEKYVNEQKPKASRILRLCAQVADALEHAHSQGVLHRDLKPSNIMITKGGSEGSLAEQPKLLDFGLGKAMFRGDPDFDSGHTLTGSVIGTPLFMAPEQARGENEDLDGRADIYALGVIVYVMVVRRHPHRIDEKDRWETIREIAEGRPRPPSQIRPGFDAELELIIMKALERDRERRYQTAGEFGAALRRFIQERGKAKDATGE